MKNKSFVTANDEVGYIIVFDGISCSYFEKKRCGDIV